MASDWSDLKARVLSATGMTILGCIGIYLGGICFQILISFIIAVMVWELWTMISAERQASGMLLAALSASIVSSVSHVETSWSLAFLILVPVIGTVFIDQKRVVFALFSMAFFIFGWTLIEFRSAYGIFWIFWLVGVVVVTDVFGYFAGRMLGGPKFWPAVSPKKTWSGTLAGWVGSAFFGYIILQYSNLGWNIVLFSILLSFASQIGDMAESALKRKLYVKDSSSLIPGHGGFFDRFDGLLGASLVMFIVLNLFGLPEVLF